MSMRITTLFSIMVSYVYSTQAQKVCRQNYKNEASISYNNLMSLVLGSLGLSYERTIYHKRNKANFLSIQLDYASKIDLYGIDVSNRIATKYFSPTLKYNFGDKHIYSLGLGVVISNLNTASSSLCFFNYKYDFRKQKLTVGGGLQVSYLGLAKSEEHYNPIRPTQNISSLFWSPYSYSSTWQDRILFNIRVGKYF
jgi:hypothetical protein